MNGWMICHVDFYGRKKSFVIFLLILRFGMNEKVYVWGIW